MFKAISTVMTAVAIILLEWHHQVFVIPEMPLVVSGFGTLQEAWVQSLVELRSHMPRAWAKKRKRGNVQG